MSNRRRPDGMYHRDGKKFKMLVGSRRQVKNGIAYKTSGGLKKKDLVRKGGRIRSRKACDAAKEKLDNNPKFMAFVERAKQRKGQSFKAFTPKKK